jgi:RNA polymerase sigma-70 factor (ECF subfamily)
MAASDEQLMLAYAEGDARAFEALYAKHKGALYRFVLRSVTARGEAEELHQDVWLRVIEARGRYTPSARFTTWLYTIAHNRLVDHWRTRGLALVSLDAEDAAPAEPAAPPSSQPHLQAEAREMLERLAAAIAALPLVQREAFLLHQEAGMGVAEIAQATGVDEEAAKSRLRYAMKKLKEAIGDE